MPIDGNPDYSRSRPSVTQSLRAAAALATLRQPQHPLDLSAQGFLASFKGLLIAGATLLLTTTVSEIHLEIPPAFIKHAIILSGSWLFSAAWVIAFCDILNIPVRHALAANTTINWISAVVAVPQAIAAVAFASGLIGLVNFYSVLILIAGWGLGAQISGLAMAAGIGMGYAVPIVLSGSLVSVIATHALHQVWTAIF